ncbi:MAG TPA: sigma-70 family RNA polymerase sigma factor [Thermoguttaceae bacterium]|nr:sigma-70 family RNA polymerase sigma factor [Thermoguttaceae bacterium]
MKGPDNDPIVDETSLERRSVSSHLLATLKTRDPEAWRRLSSLYAPEVYRWCLKKGLRPEDAADVVQEVFRTVAGRIDDFHRKSPRDTFRGWLWTITRNKLGDFFRREQRRAVAEGGTDAYQRLSQLAADVTEDSEVAPVAASCELSHRVLEIIRSEFEEKTWRAFWEVVVEQVSPRGTAAKLGMTTNAVYVAKSRVLRRLREELGDVID